MYDNPRPDLKIKPCPFWELLGESKVMLMVGID